MTLIACENASAEHLLVTDRYQAELAARIVEALRTSGISQAELARRLGVSTTAVLRWTKGDMSPGPKNLSQIASVTRADPAWLLTGELSEAAVERDDDPEIRHPSLRAFRERFGEEYSAKTLARLRKFAAGDGQFPTTAEGWKWIAETIERGAP